MIALTVGDVADRATVDAFREEDADCLVLGPDDTVDDGVRQIRANGVSLVAPATPGAAARARVLADAAGVRAVGPDLPPRTADDDRAPARSSGARRLTVDLVSMGGSHVSAGVYEHRVDVCGGVAVMRHRLSVSPDDTESGRALALARSCLDRLGVRDGASTVELDDDAGDLRFVHAFPAPAVPAIPADAAFCAFGHSHQHLYAESLLRAREFERRMVLPLRPGATTLAIALLRTPDGAAAPGAAGFRVVRRLTGFHSLRPIPGPGVAGAIAVACFVHPDRPSVANSLAILHELEDSGALFAREQELFGLAARPA